MGTRRPQTNVNVTQTVGDNRGGVTGLVVESLTGNIFYSGPAANPPTVESVVAYLRKVSGRVTLTEVPDPLRPEQIWRLAYYAHTPGQEALGPRKLPERVTQLFTRDRALQRRQRAVLLAEPGMGRTPALVQLQAERAERTLEQVRDDPDAFAAGRDCAADGDALVVPILIDLAQLNSGLSLYTLIRNSFNSHVRPDGEKVAQLETGQVADFLNSYCCLILMDNLDALISHSQSHNMHLVRAMMEVHNEHRYLIACRTGSYREQLGPLNVIYLEPLAAELVRQILDTGQGPRYEQLSGSMQTLLGNRRNLTLILETREREDGDLFSFSNKGQLLKVYKEHRLEEERERAAEQDSAFPSLRLLSGVLEHLAYTMQLGHKLVLDEREIMDALRSYLERWHEATHWHDLLMALEEMRLMEQDARKTGWQFAQRSDQAYFAASAIVAQPERLGPVLQEVDDYWWRETFEVLVGLLPDPTVLFFDLIERSPLVAANSIQFAGPSVHGRVTTAVLDALVEHMEYESSFRRKYIAERIGESTHPRRLEALFLAFHNEWSSTVAKAIGRALGQWAREQAGDPAPALQEAEQAAFRLMRNNPKPVCHVVARYAQAIDDGEARQELLAWLKDRKQPARVRGLAAIYLGQLACTRSEDALWASLLERYGVNEESYVAWCVTEALTDSGPQYAEEKALALLTGEAYCTDDWCEARARAIYLLGWISEKNARTFLYQALQDEHPLVRGFAAEATARLDLPGTRDWLHDMLAGRSAPEAGGVDRAPETDPDVLRRVAEALAQIGTAESIPFLERYRYYERTRTRLMMKQAIAEIRQRYGMETATTAA